MKHLARQFKNAFNGQPIAKLFFAGRDKETKMLTGKRRPLFRAVTLSLLFVAVLAQTAAPEAATINAPGAVQAPVEFALRTTDGGEISSEMLRGDVVVLAFGASWLPLSRTQVESVQKLSDQYSGRNVRVYWVSTDSDSPKSKNYATDSQLRDYARKHGLKIAVLRDPGGKLLKQFRIDQLPAVVILDREGTVSGQPIGGLDPSGNLAEQLASRLEKLL